MAIAVKDLFALRPVFRHAFFALPLPVVHVVNIELLVVTAALGGDVPGIENVTVQSRYYIMYARVHPGRDRGNGQEAGGTRCRPGDRGPEGEWPIRLLAFPAFGGFPAGLAPDHGPDTNRSQTSSDDSDIPKRWFGEGVE